jgi:prefoldin subunit 5
MPTREITVEELTMRVERNIDAIENETKEMRHALKLFASNPRKYQPQLENLAMAAMNASRSVGAILRSLDLPED